MQENLQGITIPKTSRKKGNPTAVRLRGVKRPKRPESAKAPRLIKPITQRDKVELVKYYAQQMGAQPYMLILLGLNTGLRISDILPLTVGDFRGKDRLVLYEKKTGKRTEIPLHGAVLRDVRALTADKEDDELLFASRQKRRAGEPIDYVTAYRWVKKACDKAGITQYIGCHTLRKTYGYTMYRKYRDVGELMKRFNHSSQTVTLRYIGMSQEVEDQRARETLI